MARLSIESVIMASSVPAEFQIGGIFVPPLLVAGLLRSSRVSANRQGAQSISLVSIPVLPAVGICSSVV